MLVRRSTGPALKNFYYYSLALGLLLVLLYTGCDTAITGTAFENQPPRTQLSVRDTSLVDNLLPSERLSSTVAVSWSGTDPDGYVAAYELRYYNEGETPAPEANWVQTTRTDTLILLPIPRGERVANVVFEVRAIDNEGLKDPNPARTVFPIRNSPPTIRFNTFDLPPDTTFNVFSFAWTVQDPEGPANLDRIEVSLNDSLNFVPLAVDADYVTFVADVAPEDPAQIVEVQVFTGRAFQRTDVTVPGLRLDSDNTLYLRAVDQTDTTSTIQQFTWYVRKPKGRVLFVNDWRASSWPTVQRFHLELLREYLPAGTEIDVWNLSTPYTTGTTGIVNRSEALPPSAEPGLRRQMAYWDYIYWVSSNAISSIRGSNLPFISPVLDVFFDQGGKLMVHTPIIQPEDPSENVGNPAILLLPVSRVITLPDSVRRLQLPIGAGVTPASPLPGVSEALPPLQSNRFFISELPFEAEGTNAIPLYRADYQYRTQTGATGDWPSPRTVASISADRRIALFALPLINEQTGQPVLLGADGDADAPRRAVHQILESLGFPRR
jgi:hypothetical protein